MDPTRKVLPGTISFLLRAGVKAVRTAAQRLAQKPAGEPKPEKVCVDRPPVGPANVIVEQRPTVEVVAPEQPTFTVGNWVPPDIRDAVVEHWPVLSAVPVDKLDISVRLANCLVAAGVGTVGEALQVSAQDWLKTRGFGRRSLVELCDVLRDTVAGINGGGRFGVQVSSEPVGAPSVSMVRDSLGDWSWRFNGISPEQLEFLRQIPFDNPAPGRFYFLDIQVTGRLGIFLFDRQVKTLGEVIDWSIEDLLKTARFGRTSLGHLEVLLSAVVERMNASSWEMAPTAAPSPPVRPRKNQDLPGNWIPGDIRDAVMGELEALRQIPRTRSDKGVYRIGGVSITAVAGNLLFRKRWTLEQLIRRSRRELHQTGFKRENIVELGDVLRTLVAQRRG
ncbi:MAG: hypothetical protein NT099_01355 [Candidatus Saganbacteria bacterium]|nr:hypothetical protein [Candidatus Saganbacteria bacterium]